MLVLTRRMDEAILIGDPEKPLVRILVCRLGPEKVRLGFETDLPIVREELFLERRQAEGKT